MPEKNEYIEVNKQTNSLAYEGMYRDILLVPVVTALFFVCLYLPLSLPLVIFYPIFLTYLISKRAKRGAAILEKMDVVNKEEAFYHFDNPVLLLYTFLYVIPLFIVLYIACDVLLIQHDLRIYSRTMIKNNDYFSELIINLQLLKPFFSDSFYQTFIGEDGHRYFFYLFSVTFMMSAFLWLGSFSYSKLIVSVYEKKSLKKYDTLEKNIAFAQSQAIILAILVPILILLYEKFILTGISDARYPHDIYKAIRLHTLFPYIIIYTIMITIGTIKRFRFLSKEKEGS